MNWFAIALGMGSGFVLRESDDELNRTLGNLIVAGLVVAVTVKS